jgi:hypothetical protein
MMRREDINQFSVVADGRLEGIVFRSHVLRFLQTHAELHQPLPEYSVRKCPPTLQLRCFRHRGCLALNRNDNHFVGSRVMNEGHSPKHMSRIARNTRFPARGFRCESHLGFNGEFVERSHFKFEELSFVQISENRGTIRIGTF